MPNWFTRLFASKKGSKSAQPADIDEKAAQVWYDHKSKLMEEMLGKEHGMVMHAIIPYCVGGALDLYYYPNGIPGTAIATKELAELPNEGSKNVDFSCYELVMFTRHTCNLDEVKDPGTKFGTIHNTMNRVMNTIARYSETTELNPRETCEFPSDMEHIGGKCLIFDSYGSRSDALVESFGLLAIIQIFRGEMDFARANGGKLLLEKLKAAGHYPYSDLERDSVV